MSGAGAPRRVGRAAALVLGNGLLLVALLLLAEAVYRVYRDGFGGAVEKLRQERAVPFSNLGTSNWVVFDADLGYRLNASRPGVNRFSVRHGDLAVPKPKGLFRVLYLGDSVPWDKHGFVKMTREALEERGDIEVINAAVPGYTSYQEVRFFEKYLTPTQPDLVLWTYCMNDNHRFLHEFDANANMLFTKEALETFHVETTWDLIVGKSYLLTLARLQWASRAWEKDWASDTPWGNKIDKIAWKDYSWRDYETYLGELRETISAGQGTLAILVFPTRQQIAYARKTDDLREVVKPQRKLAALCEKYGVACLDLYPVFSAVPAADETLFRDGVHLTPAGHALAARAILRFLEEEKLLPPG